MPSAVDLNWVDYCIIGFFLVSTLAGLLRGLVREIIAVLTWFAAFVLASLFASPLASHFATEKVLVPMSGLPPVIGAHAAQSISLLAISISFIAIFIFTLIMGSLFNYFISRAVDVGGISIGNRLMGGLFGLIRGFLVNIIFIFLVQLSPLSLQAPWTQSLFVQSFKPLVKWLENWVQPGLENFKGNIHSMAVVQNIKDLL